MYIEHPYFYEGKYYANIDGEMIEITKEVAYAMNNFYRSSKAKKVEIKNELGEVVDKMLREVPYSGQSIDGEGKLITGAQFSIICIDRSPSPKYK